MRTFLILIILISSQSLFAETTQDLLSSEPVVGVEGDRKVNCFYHLTQQGATQVSQYKNDKDFDEYKNILRRQYAPGLAKIKELEEYLDRSKRQSAKEVSKYMIPTLPTSCEKQVYLESLAAEFGIAGVKSKPLQFLQRMRKLNSYKIRRPDFPRSEFCVHSCKIERKSNDCLRFCKIKSNEITKIIFGQGTVYNGFKKIPFTSCQVANGIQRNRYIINRAIHLSQLKNKSRKLFSFLDGLISEWKVFEKKKEKIIGLIQGQIKKIKNEKCTKDSVEFVKKIKNKVRRLESSRAKGTGFYVKGEEIFLISAQHVGADRYSSQPNQLDVLTYSEGGKENFANFRVKPGEYDRSKDIMKQKINKKVPALDVVSSSSVPKYLDSFTVAGFSGSRGRKFTTYPCYFKGYFNDLKRYSNSRYLLHCPAMVKSMGGISGGPAIDKNGKVWGVNTEEIISENLFVVSPLSKRNGKVKMGIQTRGESDRCYKIVKNKHEVEELVQYSCSIYPDNLIESY